MEETNGNIMEETNEYLNKMVGQMIDATGVPVCFICGKPLPPKAYALRLGFRLG